MQRRKFIRNLGAISGMMMATPAIAGEQLFEQEESQLSGNKFRPDNSEVLPGVWKFTIGIPEKITPQTTRTIAPDKKSLSVLPVVERCKVIPTGQVNNRGVIVNLPIKANEYLYGLGLQLQSFQQRGLKKTIRVNADPILDSGDSHAPVPFFVSSEGYGVFVDTARYATFYMGNKHKKVMTKAPVSKGNDGWNNLNGASERLGFGTDSEIIIEIPRTKGVDIYIFGGPTLLNAVQRYNLFSGGGVLPPKWGLGFWYRVKSDFNQSEVMKISEYFRKRNIPCDVLGLEPGWQTHSYSCSYVWSKNFPDPAGMISELKSNHFKVNLWEHAFVHPSSPIHKDLIPYSGDYTVWEGLVPDFIEPQARELFSAFHKKHHGDLGISGYKADECDNSDYTGNWSFPELSSFPSGADGEQMHNLFGLRYQDALLSIFAKAKQATYGLVRSSGALAAPYPFVLYSDLYNHKTFIHGIAQASLSGLLWTPEVRDAKSNEDLIRRLQSAVFSPLAMVNAWYLKNVPWKQIERKANNEGNFANDWEKLEDACREIIKLRMQLIPYLHAAFARYKALGIPPFRALIMDYINDPSLRDISNQFMVGENLLVAPVVEGDSGRKIYLPEGEWFDFWSHKKYAGKREYTVDVPLNIIPVFVKSGAIIPLATATLHTEDPEAYNITALVFGKNEKPAVLYAGDGEVNDLIKTELHWDNSSQKGKLIESGGGAQKVRYAVVEWKVID